MIKLHAGQRAALIVAVAVSTLAFVFHAQGQATATQDALARFPVAHEHNAAWCLGYLYIYPDSIAYDATWPASAKNHSFVLRRSDLKEAGRWSRSGQSLKAVELKSVKATYHFWWLANEQDVISGRAYQSNPPDAGEPDLLIAAIRNPATLTNETGPPAQAPANASSATVSQLQQIPDSPLASALAAPSAAAGPVSAAEPETRFAVAHAHNLLYCVGYLYVSPGRVRYEVAQPVGDKKHAFDLSRSEITGVQQWILVGTPRNAAEIRTSHGNYHFWLLPDGSDVVNTPYRQWNVNSVVPIGPLIDALQRQQ